MAKIAHELQPAGGLLAEGCGWRVSDILCTSGPQDRPFEEQHSLVSIAIVMAGSFQYRSTGGRELMTPGSLLLGSVGQCFECGHEHGTGDRCLAFRYTPQYFETIAAGAEGWHGNLGFDALRLPPLRALAQLVARACSGIAAPGRLSWEELGITLAAQAIRLTAGLPHDAGNPPPAAIARVTRVIRMIDGYPGADLALETLAREARLSPYHFLRTFENLTGLTPHQYVLRMRLREAAVRLALEPARILDVALDCGFSDVSNFNRAFRTEFGVSPRAFRRELAPTPEPRV